MAVLQLGHELAFDFSASQRVVQGVPTVGAPKKQTDDGMTIQVTTTQQRHPANNKEEEVGRQETHLLHFDTANQYYRGALSLFHLVQQKPSAPLISKFNQTHSTKIVEIVIPPPFDKILSEGMTLDSIPRRQTYYHNSTITTSVSIRVTPYDDFLVSWGILW